MGTGGGKMTQTIWKWNLQTGSTTISMPVHARVLSVQEQCGVVELWALVQPSSPKRSRTFSIYMTGQELYDDPGIYIGTVQVLGGEIVLHVFETTGTAFTPEGGRDVKTGD
jgi:hypothetical protein